MDILDSIRQPVAEPLKQYEAYVQAALRSNNPYLTPILDYLFGNRGKGIRPLLVMLSAALHAGNRPIGDRSCLAAMLVEMVHTASLVHDDVVDEADLRRGKPSLNALWQSRTAVLVGDYILSRTFQAGMDSGEYDIVTFIVRSLSELCEGELIQSRQSDRLEMTRDIYLDIIYKKTATLIGSCSGAGALSTGASSGEVARMKRFGDALGIAFQIRDDILDYAAESQTGKPACGDLRERKITLPLLTLLEKSCESERKALLQKIAGVREHPENVESLCRAVLEGGGIEMASVIMEEYLGEARELLAPYPDTPPRRSLLALCDFVAERAK